MDSCQVCEEPLTEARHFYGGIVCVSCRSFFRRATQDAATGCYSRNCIHNTNTCTINPQNRTSCKACRYYKCLAVGLKLCPGESGSSSYHSTTSSSSYTKGWEPPDCSGQADNATNSTPQGRSSSTRQGTSSTAASSPAQPGPGGGWSIKLEPGLAGATDQCYALNLQRPTVISPLPPTPDTYSRTEYVSVIKYVDQKRDDNHLHWPRYHHKKFNRH